MGEAGSEEISWKFNPSDYHTKQEMVIAMSDFFSNALSLYFPVEVPPFAPSQLPANPMYASLSEETLLQSIQKHITNYEQVENIPVSFNNVLTEDQALKNYKRLNEYIKNFAGISTDCVSGNPTCTLMILKDEEFQGTFDFFTLDSSNTVITSHIGDSQATRSYGVMIAEGNHLRFLIEGYDVDNVLVVPLDPDFNRMDYIASLYPVGIECDDVVGNFKFQTEKALASLRLACVAHGYDIDPSQFSLHSPGAVPENPQEIPGDDPSFSQESPEYEKDPQDSPDIEATGLFSDMKEATISHFTVIVDDENKTIFE
jgi:hypothetical protein